MAYYSHLITAISSTLLRLAAFFFLRWIPGHHFPPIIFTLGAIYFAAFGRSFLTTSPYEVIADELDIITKETLVQDESGEEVELVESAEHEPLKELDIEETVLLARKDSAIWRSLLLGLPSPTSLFWTLVAAGINLALVGMTWDLIYRPYMVYDSHELSFTRVGYVSDHSARLLVREPHVNRLPIFVSYRYSDAPLAVDAHGAYPDTSWKKHQGMIDSLDNSTDYTATVTLTGLQPDTRYQYAFSNNHTGYFRTAPPSGLQPKRNHNKYTFLHTSCILPHFPYNPFSHPLEIPGFKHLAAWLPKLQAQFMLFLGDFIYIDVPYRFGTDSETYRAAYRRIYSSPDWPAVANSLPWIHVWDDHEIANDWDRNTSGVFPASLDAYLSYHVSVNPPPVRLGETYFAFAQGPVQFFLLDTRTYRSPNNDNATDVDKTMLGKQQLADLLLWLQTPPPRGVKWKIVGSSVPFTKNWRYGDKDTWGKHLIERQIILESMWTAVDAYGIGVVVLSGDRHEFAATEFRPPKGAKWSRRAVVHEFSTSPLSMFYLPFKTYAQKDDEDVCIKYIPNGNSKFGAIEIESPESSDQSLLHYRLFIDGREIWSYTVVTPESRHSPFFLL